jgi:DNA-binding transcriptional MerR regulator
MAVTLPTLLTAAEMARALWLTRTTVARWIARGLLVPVARTGEGRPLFGLDALEQIKRRRTRGARGGRAR